MRWLWLRLAPLFALAGASSVLESRLAVYHSTQSFHSHAKDYGRQPVASAAPAPAVPVVTEEAILEVSGPLPVDFNERFVQAVVKAVDCDPNAVKVLKTAPADDVGQNVVTLTFQGPAEVVSAVKDQAADPDSRLASGSIHDFLVERAPELPPPQIGSGADPVKVPESSGIDIDSSMPYGDLEAFGREDTAQELTENSVSESDTMVDQLERAEVAEEKRAVFRALTRLRGAAITSFDGIARAQTGNIDSYSKVHRWRQTHPLQHLADEESDVSKWAFRSKADF